MRCDKFYVKKTKRQKTYCSRACGTFSTALLAPQKRREAAYAKKLLTGTEENRRMEAPHSNALEEVGACENRE
jgi:hypothetical protein